MDSTNLRALRDNLLGERQLLIDEITRATRGGMAAKEVARLVTPAFGRDQVLQFVAAVTLRDSARTALAEADLDNVVDTSVTGIDAPREARLRLSADPDETPDHALLPDRIRAALRPFHITLAPARDGSDPHADPDDLLRDGQEVRLLRIEPRV
jgi:hypothetical protein